MNCTLEIDLSKIKANYHLLTKRCSNAIIGASVKGNSYGLGANKIAKALEQENCNIFFVADIEEGIKLRKSLSDQSEIFILNGVYQKSLLEFREYNLIPVLNNLEQIKLWQKFSISQSQILSCLLHFNTGMNRLGIPDSEIKQLINNQDLLENLDILYIMSHLAAAEEMENPYNIEQLTKFHEYTKYFPKIPRSLANSSGIFLGDSYHFDLVRPGAALYGLNPLSSGQVNPMQNPVALTAPIIQLQQLTENNSIGYNRTFMTKRSSMIATLPLGYADGYSRNFSNIGEVFIDNYKVPVVGRVSMDLINIDVTDLPPEKIFLGAKVEIIGNNCTPDKIAHIINTIGYEILTSLGNRYKRIYTNDN